MAQIPSVATIPPGIVSLADHESHARAVMDENAWAYIGGGAPDEITLRANRSAWDAISLLPRVLRAMKGGHPGVHLLGRELRHPVLLAPIAFQRLAHPMANWRRPGPELPIQHGARGRRTRGTRRCPARAALVPAVHAA